jgi:hypothetical protein
MRWSPMINLPDRPYQGRADDPRSSDRQSVGILFHFLIFSPPADPILRMLSKSLCKTPRGAVPWHSFLFLEMRRVMPCSRPSPRFSRSIFGKLFGIDCASFRYSLVIGGPHFCQSLRFARINALSMFHCFDISIGGWPMKPGAFRMVHSTTRTF